jgi:hypothetical protein
MFFGISIHIPKFNSIFFWKDTQNLVKNIINMDYTILLIVWVFLSLIVASYSKNKVLGYWGGFFVSLFLSPALGLIISLMSKDCKSFFCMRFGKRMKAIRVEERKGNRDVALEKVMEIAQWLQRIIHSSQKPEHYVLYRERIKDKILELGGEIPDSWKETSAR